MVQKSSMEELGRASLEAFRQADKNPIVVVLDNVRSMHNVGSIFRTADAFAVHKIYLCGITPKPPHREIHKTALGSELSVEWSYATNAQALLSELRGTGAKLWAVEQTNASVPLSDIQVDKSSLHVLVLGNEVDGISDEVLALCDGFVEIPQWGTKHSLNVSVAAGVVLWHFASTIRYGYTKTP